VRPRRPSAASFGFVAAACFRARFLGGVGGGGDERVDAPCPQERSGELRGLGSRHAVVGSLAWQNPRPDERQLPEQNAQGERAAAGVRATVTFSLLLSKPFLQKRMQNIARVYLNE
jgi:hypothetical protein